MTDNPKHDAPNSQGLKTGPIANPVVVLRKEFDEWALLYNPDSADAVGINPSGIAIWESLDGTKGPDEIAEILQVRFTDVPDSVVDDTSAFIDELEQRGFVGYEVEVDAG